MSFETSTIPTDIPDDGAASGPASPRRIEVEAERAQRCSLLRGELDRILSPAAGYRTTVLEIGCGHGHFLESFAGAHTDQFCLGIDYCAERARRAARKQARNRHGNLCFLRAEVSEFLDALPMGRTFDTVFVLFPDPWPKRRHRKYRLISERFLSRLAAITRPGASLLFRTDAATYFSEAKDTIAGHANWRLDPDVPWPFEQGTVFQAKAVSYQSLIAVNATPAR